MSRVSTQAVHRTLRQWIENELSGAAGKNQVISKKEEGGLSGLARNAVQNARQAGGKGARVTVKGALIHFDGLFDAVFPKEKGTGSGDSINSGDPQMLSEDKVDNLDLLWHGPVHHAFRQVLSEKNDPGGETLDLHWYPGLRICLREASEGLNDVCGLFEGDASHARRHLNPELLPTEVKGDVDQLRQRLMALFESPFDKLLEEDSEMLEEETVEPDVLFAFMQEVDGIIAALDKLSFPEPGDDPATQWAHIELKSALRESADSLRAARDAGPHFFVSPSEMTWEFFDGLSKEDKNRFWVEAQHIPSFDMEELGDPLDYAAADPNLNKKLEGVVGKDRLDELKEEVVALVEKSAAKDSDGNARVRKRPKLSADVLMHAGEPWAYQILVSTDYVTSDGFEWSGWIATRVDRLGNEFDRELGGGD
jgi:hypothetical protein